MSGQSVAPPPPYLVDPTRQFRPKEGCFMAVSSDFTSMMSYVVSLILVLFSCNVIHGVTRHLSQPRVIPEIIVGLIFGNNRFSDSTTAADSAIARTLHAISEVGMVCYMFVLGLEMDPYVLFLPPTREVMVAYTGILSTFIVACIVIPFLTLSKHTNLRYVLILSISLSNTASPLLTRLITELKIGKSDIGRLAVSAGMHSDMISTLLISIGLISIPTREEGVYIGEIVFLTALVFIQVFLMVKGLPSFTNWINDNNPEGKHMNGPHLVLAIGTVVMVCCFAPLAAVSPIMNSFLTGLIIPRGGRLSKMLTNKINYFLSVLFYPIYFCWVGMQADFRQFKTKDWHTWANLLLLFIAATLGKISGTLIAGIMLGFNWPESIALGLLLNIKGHFHIYCAMIALEAGAMNTGSFIDMVIVSILTIVYVPLVVAFIVGRARKRSCLQPMTLQWLDPGSELRMLLCLHGPHNVPTAINIMEITRGGHSGLVVYATDMIELNSRTAATLVQGEDLDAVTVADETIVSMREQISNAIQAYMDASGDGISLHRMLALSTFSNMHQDICNIAQDVSASFIILPFHKSQKVDGRMDEGHANFRNVNRKVLRHAPCSVGILVDRGLGLINKVKSHSYVSLNAAVIFIGGRDDREALAYAGRVSRHPGVTLTVIRFVHDTNADNSSILAGGIHIAGSLKQVEEEMRIDDECFAQFYDMHVAAGKVGYAEKYVANSAETVSSLRGMEGQYALFIVGRGGPGGRANTILTAGMNDWEECPELGPIGDILSSSDFSIMASVLVIQQHILKHDIEGISDEFSVM
uniref:Cation/H(+) antiporter 28-like n=1 Tax=Nelumbo nucifera TaxID=4432 RepID=A0A822YFC0_NELNU|nr:TPA_asm: hypothetical protein HUJ06_031174 [Nelumbo nucifera]